MGDVTDTTSKFDSSLLVKRICGISALKERFQNTFYNLFEDEHRVHSE